jgi:nanoRNase/pAp phosphatase (c-di-AMP/oligoRNAs hydrolase)
VKQENLKRLLAVMAGKSELLILTHNNPDPDAIGSAVALQYLLQQLLGITSQITYKGIIGRSENKAMVRYLGYPLKRLNPNQLNAAGAIALVDTQPGAGNNALPPPFKPTIVIDHHPWQDASRLADFVDVRPEVGATASILMEYFRAAEVVPPSQIATALFYGIKTDTMGLGRGTTSTDTTAICQLLPRLDIEAISKIEYAQVPPDYFKNFTIALQNARIYNGVVISYLGEMSYPDLVAEIADFLLRMRGSHWVICMGVYEERLILSIRTYKRQGAGRLAQKMVGKRGIAGGHSSLAGGQIDLNEEDPDQWVETFIQRALEHLNVSQTNGRSLV